jgi:cytochrome P450
VDTPRDIVCVSTAVVTDGSRRHDFCLGAPLARLEAPIAIATLLRRLPDLELAADQVVWHEHSLLRGLRALPVRFTRPPEA